MQVSKQQQQHSPQVKKCSKVTIANNSQSCAQKSVATSLTRVLLDLNNTAATSGQAKTILKSSNSNTSVEAVGGDKLLDCSSKIDFSASAPTDLKQQPLLAATSNNDMNNNGDFSGDTARHQQVIQSKLPSGEQSNSSPSLELAATRISLDTKVPHPSSQDFHSGLRMGGDERRVEVEEVSYYNDEATCSNFQLKPRAGGSLDNNTRPKLIAASKESKLKVCMPKTATSCQHLRGQQQQQQQQQTQCFQQRVQQANNSRDYLNDVDEDYNDEYDTRYHNASVERQTNQAEASASANLAAAAAERQSSSERTAAANCGNQLRADSLSVPNSPKAKSAPATPCNITPTAFHQTNSLHLSSLLNPSPANTMPTDMRKNISATCRVLPSSISSSQQQQQQQMSSRALVLANGGGPNQQATVSLQHLDDLIKRGERALESNDNHGAIRYFGRCIELASSNPNSINYLKKNFKIYSHKAQAHFNLGNYKEAIDDSMAARDFNPKWTRAYFLQGKSQFSIGQHADSLAVFSFGLAQEPDNKLLFAALVDAALESPVIRAEFEPKFKKLKSLDLDKKPFVVASVLGQELLARGHGEHAAIILESALKMKPDNLKFKSSVLSTIARAYSMMKDYEKAIVYMLKELDVETELEDANGQCRVLRNLGFAYFKMRKFDTSLKRHRDQLNLAMKTKQWQQASVALNAIGHVHAAKGDFSDALTSHTRCLDILRQLGDNEYNQFEELLSIGFVHSMLNDFKAAEDRYQEAIQLLENSCVPCGGKISQEEFTIGHIMANFNLAYLSLKKQSFLRAKQHYETVMKLAQSLGNQKRAALYEMRAANGMGHAHRLYKKFEDAKVWFERQLQLAESLEDQTGQSQALCNLGMTYQHFKDYNNAWRLFEENLKLVDKNAHLKAYACSYIGSMCFLAGRYNEAQVHYETSSNLFKDLDYCLAEKKTVDLNMAIAYTHNNQTSNATAATTHQKKVMMAT